MGSGDRAYRIALGEAQGQAQAIQEHETAMIPIVKERGEMELALQQSLFEQQFTQAEKLHLFSERIEAAEAEAQQAAAKALTAAGQVSPPVFGTSATPAISKNWIYAALAIAAFLLLR